MGTEWLSEEELDAVLDEAMLGGTVYKMAAELREWRTNASRVRRARTLNDESASQGSAANIEEPTDAQIEAAMAELALNGWVCEDDTDIAAIRAALVAAQDIKDNGDWSVAAHQVGEETP